MAIFELLDYIVNEVGVNEVGVVLSSQGSAGIPGGPTAMCWVRVGSGVLVSPGIPAWFGLEGS